jgi:RNA polymerase sigma-70 factor (ECF subfamily)
MQNLPRSEVKNLLNRIADGDDQASRRLYAAYQPLVYRYVRMRIWSDDAVEEIVVDTMFTAFAKHAAYNGLSEFSTWLCGIANNLVLQWRREMAMQPPTVPDDDEEVEAARGFDWDVLSRLEHDEAGQAILACIDKLPDAQREAMYWTAVEDLGLAEASLQMAVPEGTLKSRLFHARSRIRACLERALGGDYHGVERG